MWEMAQFLVLVKAYPSVSPDLGEVECVAGVRLDDGAPTWRRLYPVPYRHLPTVHQFKKYEIIDLRVSPSRTDRRPESLTPDCDSIVRGRVLDTSNAWAERRRVVEPLVVGSMCEIARRQRDYRTSLGAFRPREVLGLTIKPRDGDWLSEKGATLDLVERKQDQASFFDTRTTSVKRLELVPYSFKLRYLCADAHCRGHAQSIIDWEIFEAYRTWRRGRSERDTLAAIEYKWADELFGAARDTVLFVGNMAHKPASFLVLGVFWPPKLQVDQLELTAFSS